MSEAATVISDEKQATAPSAKALKWLVTAIAVAMSLYHMYVAGFGPPEALIFRGTHLLFALALVFLLYPLAPGRRRRLARARRGADRPGPSPSCCTSSSTTQSITNRIIYIDDLTRRGQGLSRCWRC